MFDTQFLEGVWRGIVLTWSLTSAAGVSLTYVMLRAAKADRQTISTRNDEELSLLARRVVRGILSRMVAFVAMLVASGTLWVLPEPARELSHLAVRYGFALTFAVASIVLLWIATISLLDTLHLISDRPVGPDKEPPWTHLTSPSE